MADLSQDVKTLRRDHPLFFWGMSVVVLLLLVATTAVAIRTFQYRDQAAKLDASMSEAERSTRDRILNSQARRSEMAIALLQRELRLRAMEESSLHLALSLDDSTLYLRHGPAILRDVRITVGPDSTVRAPDGRTWRFVRALGERHVKDKETDPVLVVPEWVYHSRSAPVPPEAERRIEGGLGRYLLRLDDGTEIHTRPTSGPFAEGVRPAGFVIENDADMRAIFDAISSDTPVYIY